MATIKISDTDSMVHIYPNNDGLSERMPIMTKTYTLEELYEVYSATSDKLKLAKSSYNCAAEEFSDFLRNHKLHELHTNDATFNSLVSKRDDLSDEMHLYEIALHGIKGAIQYYQAVALNDAIARVLPKYSGKQAGPKTKEKFWKEVSKYLPNEPRIYCNYYYSVSVWDAVTGFDFSYYSNDCINTASNQFSDAFSVNVPKDAFEGRYPNNWLVWAMHINRANLNIQLKFDEFYEYMNGLHKSLCIGDTMMLSVSKFDLKEK